MRAAPLPLVRFEQEICVALVIDDLVRRSTDLLRRADDMRSYL